MPATNENLLRYNIVKSNLEDIDHQVKESGVLNKLKTMQNQQKRLKENAEDILDPSKRIKETEAVTQWFKSEVYNKEKNKIDKIWMDAVENKKISQRNFGFVANFSRFLLSLTSKNRNSCLNFNNTDFGMRIGLFMSNEDKEFEGLTEDITHPPKDKPNMSPNAFLIKLHGGGAGIKGGEAQTIFINELAEEYIQKYLDLKHLHLGLNHEGQAPFYVNYNNKGRSGLIYYREIINTDQLITEGS